MNVVVLLCAILSCVHGQALPCLPTGHDLNVILDKAFTRLDTNGDGLIQVTEFQAVIRNDDKNSDGNVTLEEFKMAFGYHEIYEPMFHHFDHNTDGVLEIGDMVQEFLVNDTNDDDQVDMKEFENFYHGSIFAAINFYHPLWADMTRKPLERLKLYRRRITNAVEASTESHLWKQPLSWSSRWEVILSRSGSNNCRLNCSSR